MAQKGDECDFAALSAMLEESDDETAGDTAVAMTAGTSGDMSSDDDIDESELEQLAGLMEAEAAEQDGVPENSFQDGVQLQDEVGVDSEEAGLPEQGAGQIEPEAGLPEEEAGHPEEKAGQLDEEAGQLKDAGMVEDAAEEEEDESDDENAMEQLRLMQEQILKLQSKLKNKKKKSPKGSSPPSGQSSKSDVSPDSAGQRSSTNISKTVSGVITQNKSPRQKLTLNAGHELKQSSPSHTGNKKDRNIFNEVKSSCSKKSEFSPRRHKDSDKHMSSSSQMGSKSESARKCSGDSSSKSRHNSSTSGGKKALLINNDIFGRETPEEATLSSRSPAATKPKMSSRSPSATKPKMSSLSSKPAVPKPKETPELKKNSASSKDDNVSSYFPDSDSDWEGLDGERCKELSKAGDEIKKLMSRGERDRIAHSSQSQRDYTPKSDTNRVAHTPKFDVSVLENRKPTWQSGSAKKWEPKVAPSPGSTATPGNSNVRHADMNDASRCPFSGIRIVNPLIPSETMKSRMTDRKMIRMSRLHTRINTSDMQGDWVTIGVIVQKSEPKMSSKGSQYSIWTLSDLEEEKTVKFFLFGVVHKQLWKTVTGSVIGLLNANVMKNSEKYQQSSQDVAVTIDNPPQLLMMGRSQDLGYCKSKTKAGRSCTQFINKQQGEFCSYHVQTMYKKQSAKRPDLQASYTGVTPRSFEKRLQAGSKGCVMYGGQSFTMGPQVAPKKKANLASLNQHQKSSTSNSGSVRGTTLSLHKLLPEDEARLRNLKEERLQEKNRVFHEMLSTPSVGSLNLVKHIVKKEVTEKDPNEGSSQKPSRVQSVTVSQVLSQMKSDLKNKRSQARAAATPSLSQPSMDMDDLFHDGETVKPLFSRKEPPNMAKLKALHVVRNKGPINKEDPNAVKKAKSPEHVEKIRKRLAEPTDDADENTPESSSGEPAKKRSRLLGNVDLDDPEVQKLLKARSRHDNQLTEKEQEKFDEYFDVREKTEGMEQKMASTKEIKCKAVSCKQCKYTAYSALDTCRQARHTLVSHEAVKRFFACKHCKKRVVTLDRYPKMDCKGCGGRTFEKTAMRTEKKVLLESEQLLTRGVEEKFLTSLF